MYKRQLLNRINGMVLSYSIGVYQSGELAGRALELFFRQYKGLEEKNSISLLTSQNPIYRTKVYEKVWKQYPAIVPGMTEKGSRGQAAVVSTFFSQLMRRKGNTVFLDWQEAIDWLTADILVYNLKRSCKNHTNYKKLEGKE